MIGETNNKRRLYVLISKDLDPVYGCVQGGHAVAEYLLKYKDTQKWNNSYLIYLYADTDIWKVKLDQRNKKYSEFYEPDLGYKLTAIAVEDSGSLFKQLKLVRNRI